MFVENGSVSLGNLVVDVNETDVKLCKTAGSVFYVHVTVHRDKFPYNKTN
jgi:hypothetical protein